MKSPYAWLAPFTTGIFLLAQVLLFNYQINFEKRMSERYDSNTQQLNQVVNNLRQASKNQNQIFADYLNKRDSVYSKNFKVLFSKINQ